MAISIIRLTIINIKMDKPQIFVFLEKSVNFSCFSVNWLPSSPKFLAAGTSPSNKGVIKVLNITENSIEIDKEVEFPNPIRCCTFDFNPEGENKVALGCSNGILEVRDMEKDIMIVSEYKAHQNMINSIDGAGGVGSGYGQSEIATCSVDGSAKVWDLRQKSEPVVSLVPESDNHSQKPRDCWALAFGGSFNSDCRYLSCGFDNGDVKVFDLRSLSLFTSYKSANGVCSLSFDRKSIDINKLYVGTLENSVLVIDLLSGNLKKLENDDFLTVIKGKKYKFACDQKGQTTIWKVLPLPQSREILISSSGDGSMSVWKYDTNEEGRFGVTEDGNKFCRPGNLNELQCAQISSQPIVSFDLHKIRQGLTVQCSIDQQIRVLAITKLDSLVS
ncbi:MAG: WD repeat-containing protein 92 [Paramarteilia canceri]